MADLLKLPALKINSGPRPLFQKGSGDHVYGCVWYCPGQKLLFSPWISGLEAQKSGQAKPSLWGRLGVRSDRPLTICAQEEKTAAMMMHQLTGCWAAQLVSCQKEKGCLWQPAKTRVVARGKGHRGDCNDTMNNSF